MTGSGVAGATDGAVGVGVGVTCSAAQNTRGK